MIEDRREGGRGIEIEAGRGDGGSGNDRGGGGERGRR